MKRLLLLALLPLAACSARSLTPEGLMEAVQARDVDCYRAMCRGVTDMPPESLRTHLKLPPFSEASEGRVTQGRGVWLAVYDEGSGPYLVTVRPATP